MLWKNPTLAAAGSRDGGGRLASQPRPCVCEGWSTKGSGRAPAVPSCTPGARPRATLLLTSVCFSFGVKKTPQNCHRSCERPSWWHFPAGGDDFFHQVSPSPGCPPSLLPSEKDGPAAAACGGKGSAAPGWQPRPQGRGAADAAGGVRAGCAPRAPGCELPLRPRAPARAGLGTCSEDAISSRAAGSCGRFPSPAPAGTTCAAGASPGGRARSRPAARGGAGLSPVAPPARDPRCPTRNQLYCLGPFLPSGKGDLPCNAPRPPGTESGPSCYGRHVNTLPSLSLSQSPASSFFLLLGERSPPIIFGERAEKGGREGA